MFVDVASFNDLAEGGMASVRANGMDVVLCKYRGNIFALNRRCGHEGAALNLGTLNGHIITCPLHFAQFDIVSGQALLGPGDRNYGREAKISRGSTLETKDLRTYQVKIVDGRILIDLPPKEESQ